MNNQLFMPEPEKVKQTVAKLHRSRLAMEEATLELEELTARLERDIRQKRLQRLRQILGGPATTKQPSEAEFERSFELAIAF